MDRRVNSQAVICNSCGEVFVLPDDTQGNLPRVLLCGHIFCTSCLTSMQCDDVIQCPDCQVSTTLPEGGVDSLPEDSRIIGLIYTAKMNKRKGTQKERLKTRWIKSLHAADNGNSQDDEQQADIKEFESTVDEALIQAAQNLDKLKQILESQIAGLAEQEMRDAQLAMEIKEVSCKAINTIHKWKNVQLNQVSRQDKQFSSDHVFSVQEKIEALETAMKMAREVRRIPFLGKYCTLDNILKTLKAPVDVQFFDMCCDSMDSKLSCVLQSEGLLSGPTLTIKIEVQQATQLSSTPRKKRNPFTPRVVKPLSAQKKDKEDLGSDALSPQSSSPRPQPHPRSSPPPPSPDPTTEAPDVIIEEEEYKEAPAPPLATHKPANDPCPTPQRRPNTNSGCKRDVTQWVVVTHIVNPSHFYVRYMAESKDAEILSKKINMFCGGEESLFTSTDFVETGSTIFVKWTDGLWCRATVLHVWQKNSEEQLKTCSVTQLASVQVFFQDTGVTESATIPSEETTPESSVTAVNKLLRKVVEAATRQQKFPPQAIRCSLKDLVPYNQATGWSNEAAVEFLRVVGTAAVKMQPLGHDTDCLLVDLMKTPVEQSSDLSFSVREYLVFIDMARLYSPVTFSWNTLSYYPPVHPSYNKELSAVVCHVNSPSDFYIRLVDDTDSILLFAKLQECYNATSSSPEKDDLSIYCPTLRQACVARYEDSNWYRAQVIGLCGHRQVQVLFVDFGNTQMLSFCDLRKIKDEFFSLPSMAVHCCLPDLVPWDGDSWSDACNSRFTSLVRKLVTVVATGRDGKTGPLRVKLFESSRDGPQTDIGARLVTEELARFKEGHNSPSPPGDDAAVWDPPLEPGSSADASDRQEQDVVTEPVEEPAEEPLDFQPQLKLLAQLKDLKVRVSHVNSPSSFYVRLTKHDSLLRRICELVKKECASTEPEDVSWKADMFCAAHINGVWERGQICSDVTSSEIAEVRRCDHGNTVKLHVGNLRPLAPAMIGSLALECTLTDIRPAGGRSTWTATACEIFSFHLSGASALVTIKELTDECPVPVILSRSNKAGQFVSIADFLSSEGLALRVRKPRDAVEEKAEKESDAQSAVRETQSPGADDEETNAGHLPPPALCVAPLPRQASVLIPPKPAPRRIMSAAKVETPLYKAPEQPSLGHMRIKVSAIGEDGLIYAWTLNAECQLEQLSQRIQRSIQTLPKQKPFTWKSVQGCAVIGSDMLWYRGQILEVRRGNVKVQYVDYGQVEDLPVVHVYPMLLCEDAPQLCVPCQLHGLKPMGPSWHRDALALLKEALLSRCVDMRVLELPSDRRKPLSVEIFVDGLSLSKILCHHMHAAMDPTVSVQSPSGISAALLLDQWDLDTEGLKKPAQPVVGPFVQPELPQVGEEFPVKVMHLQTPNELFLWPLEGVVEVDGETLDQALTRVNENISSLPPLSNFNKGSACLAKYSDGRFYRAKLMSFISNEPVMVMVQHVDFGSEDTLPISKLRQMPPELLKFPLRALKVRVAGFKAPSVNTEEKVLPYSVQWSVKAALCMIDLLSDVSASVVAHEPELTVQIYSSNGELVHLPLVSRGLAELE